MEKIALVTGAGCRVGKAIAEHLSRSGWYIWLHAFSHYSEAEALADSLGNAEAIRADLTQTAEIDRMFDVITRSGRIPRVLVHNAAVFIRKPLLELTPDEWDQTMDLNLKAAWYASRCFYQICPESSKILLIGDGNAERGFRKGAAYGISKYALNALSERLNAEMTAKLSVHLLTPSYLIKSEYESESFWESKAKQETRAVSEFLTDLDRILADYRIIK